MFWGDKSGDRMVEGAKKTPTRARNVTLQAKAEMVRALYVVLVHSPQAEKVAIQQEYYGSLYS